MMQQANNLVGSIPANLPATFDSTLQLLDFSDNYLGGVVPSDLFSMQRLHSIFLLGRGTDADGNVCAAGSNCVLLTGELPDPPCTTTLKYLHMQRQNLSGVIPASIGKCTGLNQLMLFNNQLTGLVQVIGGFLASHLL
jgi:hypothetical protein